MANRVLDLIAQKTTTSPTLDVNGQFTMQFGQFDVVNDALVKFENPHAWVDGWIFACSRAISGNTVTITIKKLAIPGAGGHAWVAALTEHLDGSKVTVTVGGE